MTKLWGKFVLILRKSLINDKKIKVSIDDFNKIENLALNQMVLPLVCDGTIKMGLTPPDKWKSFMMSVVINNYRNLNTQQKILNILKDNNIRCAILKGISVSMYYPEPLHRPLGDIDILVDEENYDRAIDILTGSKDRDSEYLKHKFHYHFTYEGVTVEIHKFMTEYTDDKYGEFLKDHLKNALDNIEIKKYQCYSFPVLNAGYQIISLLLHTQRHFYEHKTNLRMICDYAMYVQSINKEEWYKLYPILQDLKLNTFADALVILCKKYLGISVDYAIKSQIKEEIIESLLNEFLNDGQTPEFIGNLNDISIWLRIKSICMTIHTVVKNEFEIANKAPVLYPIFWAFVPLRTILRKIKGNKKTVVVTEYSIAVERRRKLCQSLNLHD